MFRRGAPAIIVAVLLLLSQVMTAAASPGAGGPGGPATGGVAAPIQKGLEKKIAAGETTTILVEFAGKADLAPAKKIKDRTKRGQAVLKALTATATTAQSAALKVVAGTKGAKATSYWLTNVLAVQSDDAKVLDKLARRLAGVAGVTSVRAPKVYPVVKPVETKAAILAAAGDPEWGVAKIRADEAWVDGILGQGIVVANVDTGVDYLHPALVDHYRGNVGGGVFDHAYDWWDPTGICGPEPCDNAAHGTHTMGTMVGGDGPGPFSPDTGVAPGAEWIAAKGCEDLFCTETSLISSGQFILAPTDLAGENPDPSKRPDIVNNSWGSGPGDPFYLEIVQAWRAAGIIPVFSSGNPGPFCGEGGSPGDFLESFSAGATDDKDLIADFSGRGPSVYGKINPDVSAPGVDVVSTVPGDGYASFSGTSMAAPHVAGALALVLSAEPTLRGNVDGATDAIRSTAVDLLDDSCGGAEDGDPNNVYGDGRIDAKAAVDLVATGGTLSGTVTDDATSAPIAGARVTANDGDRDFSTVTDTNGDYDLFLAAGSYLVTAEAFGYATGVAPAVEIVTDATTDQDFAMVALPRFTVSGTVTAAEDGSPIEGAAIKALDTPLEPVRTDAAGNYSLRLPIGTWMLHVSADGCTESGDAEVSSSTEDEVVTADFSLFRKLDDFGHACAPIAFDWLDATGQSALFGDEFAGRLTLPFAFPFYGETYEQVFLSDNGYLNFLGPDYYNSFPVAIPSSGPPNAAIYLLWQDLFLDAGSSIDYQTIGTAPDRAFVIEYANIKARGAGGTLDLQVKLWEDGRIDLLSGANPANPGDGRNATVGIENADGTDALQLGFMEPILGRNSAVRISEVPTGIVSGTVTDANDGMPVAGVEVTASPGGRTATTGEDGTYRLRLLPGSYTLAATRDPYVPGSSPAVVADGVETTIDFVLDAALASAEPTTITRSIDFGETVDVPVTLSNGGTAPLDWQARERSVGSTIPDLPETAITFLRKPVWGRVPLPAGYPRAVIDDTSGVPLSTIISDPAGDATGAVDVTTVRAGSDGASLASMAIDFTASTPMDTAVGFVFLDTDQDPKTGLPPDALFGLPTQDVGMEYFVDLFAIHDQDPVVFIVDAQTFEATAAVPATIDGQTVSFDIPLEAIGGDDGAINTALILGDFGPTDWAPDEGHGTIEPFADLPWLSALPESGTVPAGGDTSVTIRMGGTSLTPGEHQALLVFTTNAPKAPQVPIEINLTVTMPDAFGAIRGTVTDAHSGAPLGAAEVTLHTEWPAGTPLDIVATTGDDGTFRIVGPEGTWPMDVVLPGYVTSTTNVTVTRGVTTSGVDIALHKVQAHLSVDGEIPVFILTPGRQGVATLTLGNPEGHATLDVEVGEVDLGGPSSSTALPAAIGPRTLPAAADRNARTTRGLDRGATVAVPPRLAADGDILAQWQTGMTLPWGVGYSGDVWLSDPEDVIDVRFTAAGERLSDFALDWAGAWGGDMAFDAGRNLLWQVNVGGDNGIYGLDPTDGSVEQVITGSPWDGISQRGLAYDPDADVFYIGGWNEGIVYRVAGPSHPVPGETLNQCSPAEQTISGLAWNRSFGMLWEATNSESDTIWLIDPITCESVRGIPHPDGGGFNGAGLELDVVGNLWMVGQGSRNAYLVESGLPTFSDVPWLDATPTTATIAPDGTAELTVTVDTTGLTPGVYRAIVVLLTSDPDNAVVQLPVTLVVPEYQQGIDAGGTASTNSNGDAFAADRAYGSGPFGYVGSSAIKSTGAPISGTVDDGLYQDLRSGMSAYQFDVADGTYRVDLLFAELSATKAGQRVMGVRIEGTSVLSDFDVFAAAGGRNAAVDRSFVVTVTDGRLDIGFVAQRGDKPIINAILVTELPEGAPGR